MYQEECTNFVEGEMIRLARFSELDFDPQKISMLIHVQNSIGRGPFQVVAVNPINIDYPETWEPNLRAPELVLKNPRTGEVFEDAHVRGLSIFIKMSPRVN